MIGRGMLRFGTTRALSKVRDSESQTLRGLFVTVEKKSLINNLKTTRKAIVASKSTEAPISGKVTPRIHGPRISRITTLRARA